jgi:hypothetical protein
MQSSTRKREQHVYLAVEMETAALYALAQARQYQIICFAHVTNQTGQTEGDFEKGVASGSETALVALVDFCRATRSIATILPRIIVKPKTTRGRPRGAHTAPTAPFTSAGCANRARPEKVSATAAAPRTSLDAPACTAEPSARSMTSGSSTASSASKRPSREAARSETQPM